MMAKCSMEYPTFYIKSPKINLNNCSINDINNENCIMIFDVNGSICVSNKTRINCNNNLWIINTKNINIIDSTLNIDQITTNNTTTIKCKQGSTINIPNVAEFNHQIFEMVDNSKLNFKHKQNLYKNGNQEFISQCFISTKDYFYMDRDTEINCAFS